MLARLAEQAREAADAALRGHQEPAAVLLEAWTLGADPALGGRLVGRLLEARPRPDSRALALTFNPSARPLSAGLAPLWAHREQIVPAGRAPADAAGLAVAWALVEAALLGAELRQRQAAAWQRRATTRPEDGECRELWLKLLSHDPWPARRRWEALYFEPIRRAFALQLEERGLPPHRRRSVESDLRDAFFLVFLPDRRDGSPMGPALRELGVRVLEAGEGGPILELGRHLDARARLRLATCLAGRGHARATARLIWPEARRRSAVVGALLSAVEADEAALARLSDLHVLARLLTCWRSPEYTSQAAIRRVLTQNRGRARGRLRALTRDLPPATLLQAVLDQRALHARTLSAMGRLGRDWAWEERQHDYSLSGMRALTPPCDGLDADPVELDTGILRAWCALVVLRGRLLMLERWVLEGGTGQHEATFGRLLSIHMPPGLRGGERQAGRFDPLRVALRRSLPRILEELRPLLARIAVLDPGRRGIVAELHALLAPTWAPEIPLPRSAAASMITHAREAHAMLMERSRAVEDGPMRWAP